MQPPLDVIQSSVELEDRLPSQTLTLIGSLFSLDQKKIVYLAIRNRLDTGFPSLFSELKD